MHILRLFVFIYKTGAALTFGDYIIVSGFKSSQSSCSYSSLHSGLGICRSNFKSSFTWSFHIFPTKEYTSHPLFGKPIVWRSHYIFYRFLYFFIVSVNLFTSVSSIMTSTLFCLKTLTFNTLNPSNLGGVPTVTWASLHDYKLNWQKMLTYLQCTYTVQKLKLTYFV